MISALSVSKDRVKDINNKFKKKEKNIEGFSKSLRVKGHTGFTLIEILVALFLIALVLTSFNMSGSMFSPHQKLEESLDTLERAVRFSSDESILKNRIIRVLINANVDPNTLTVEYANDNDFILPSKLFDEQATLDGLSEKDIAKQKKKVENQFSKVREFQEDPIEFSDQVHIIAVGTTLTNNLQIFTESNLFFYPSGEKDGALIILANAEEIATLSIEPFTLDFKRNFYTINNNANVDDEFLSNKAQELYKDWLSWKK